MKFSKDNSFDAVVLVCLLAAGFLIFLIILDGTQLNRAIKITDAFSKFAIGIGAIATGLGGFGLIHDWIGKRRRIEEKKASIIKWTEQFPIVEYQVSWAVIEDEQNPGVLYVHDTKNKLKHWITNPKTLREINMSYGHSSKLTHQEFIKIKFGDNINTDLT